MNYPLVNMRKQIIRLKVFFDCEETPPNINLLIDNTEKNDLKISEKQKYEEFFNCVETFPDINLFTDKAEENDFKISEKQNYSSQSQETKDDIDSTKEDDFDSTREFSPAKQANANISEAKMNIRKNIVQKIAENENHKTEDDIVLHILLVFLNELEHPLLKFFNLVGTSLRLFSS